MELGHRLVDVASGDLDRLVDCVGPASVLLAPGDVEGAELARCDADVGGIEVAVDVEVRGVAVQSFAHQVGKPANPEEIVEWTSVTSGR